MAQADFYILAQSDDQSRFLTLCRLVEKALRHGHRIHIHTDTLEQARELDQWLWSFRPDSFIPHSLQDEPDAAEVPVTLGHQALAADLKPFDEAALLINLAREVPDFYASFQRVAEVATQQPELLSATRDHFRFFREHGYNTTTHRLK